MARLRYRLRLSRCTSSGTYAVHNSTTTLVYAVMSLLERQCQHTSTSTNTMGISDPSALAAVFPSVLTTQLHFHHEHLLLSTRTGVLLPQNATLHNHSVFTVSCHCWSCFWAQRRKGSSQTCSTAQSQPSLCSDPSQIKSMPKQQYPSSTWARQTDRNFRKSFCQTARR